MKRKILWIAVLMGSCALRGMAQQVVPADVAGDKEYHRACREYELKGEEAVGTLQAYLSQYPDSRHKNRVVSLIASAFFTEGKYGEAVDLFHTCDLEALPDKERDDCTLRLATACLKEGDLHEAAIWFTVLKETDSAYRDDAAYNLAYIDYAERRYDKALEGFASLQQDAVYGALVPYYIGEIYLLKKNHAQAETVASAYLERYPSNENVPQMERILGEARFGQNNYTGAVAPLERYCATAERPQRKVLYELGMSYFHNGVYAKAAATLGETTAINDALSQNAYLHMGLAYVNLKDRNRARMAFEQAANGDADRKVKEQALYNYALCIHETSYSPFAESVTVFERFLNEFPDSPYTDRVNDYLTEVYLNTRSYEAALKSIDKIAHPGTRILEAKQKILFRLGTQAFANADFEEAIGYFNRSLELGSYDRATQADAYFWRGESRYRLERFGQAGNDFRQYLETTADRNGQPYGWALYNLGYTYFKQQNYDAAQNWFSRFTERGSANDRTMQADAYNRLGDGDFHNRRFDTAFQYYARSVETDASLGDYSLYQEGIVQGLQRDYNGKIQTLNRLIADYPASQYMDEALYEQGRAFVQLEDNANAISRFDLLVKRFPESDMARRAANEIGLLYYQDDRYPEAIRAYKQVIAAYPGSEEARLAQRDLKSIYIDLNRVDEYAEFASSLPGGANFDVNERDSLTYVAAERVYMRGETDEARNSFIRYLQTFPDGAFSLDACYYLGLMAYNRQDYIDATDRLDKVLAYPGNKYSESAMRMRAEIAYLSKDYEKSGEIYGQLKDKAATSEGRQAAQTGALRSAYLSGDAEKTILAATDLLAEAKLSPELSNEAHYDRAQMYLNEGQTEAAVNDFEVLARDTRNVYGAEAKYRLAQIRFDAGQTEQAEQEVLNYIETSTPHAYWLARSFVLLADIYMKLGNKADARQYLLSLQQNYQAEDDIAEMIATRLEKLNN